MPSLSLPMSMPSIGCSILLTNLCTWFVRCFVRLALSVHEQRITSNSTNNKKCNHRPTATICLFLSHPLSHLLSHHPTMQPSNRLKTTDVPQLTLALGANINKDAIKEGTDVYLECHVRANPWVYEVTWLFEGRPLVSDHSAGIIIANQSLVLQKVRRTSRGKYQCVGRIKLGFSKSNPLYLRVQCK